MTPTVLVLIGLPASGKTTWAFQHCRENTDTIHIGRNDFRMMLRDEVVCDHKTEGLITHLMAATLMGAIKRKFNVIVDNTNLRADYINAVCELVSGHAEVAFKIFDVPVEECVKRNEGRKEMPGWVPDDVIRRMEAEFKALMATYVFTRRPVRETWKEDRPGAFHKG